MTLEKMKGQKGAVAIIVAVSLVAFIGFAALAIDVGHLYVVRNELQNAADAGALAGARVLYTNDGTAIRTDANLIGHDVAEANKSEKVPVEVNWTGGNAGDVERGHWSFGLGDLARGFYPNDSDVIIPLSGYSTVALDQMVDFINAVRVRTRREATPAASFFARIFGYEGFTLQAEAIAYRGFAGNIPALELDQPIGICKQSIVDASGNYTCNYGRMITSGAGGSTTHLTGGWTDYNQKNSPCLGGTNSQTVKSLVCGPGNPDEVVLGQPMATSGGEIEAALFKLRDCWANAQIDTNDDGIPDAPIDSNSDGIPDQAWNLTLVVIDCPKNNVGVCSEALGAVDVNVLWITGPGTPKWEDAPKKMENWNSTNPDGRIRWDSFVAQFGLKDLGGGPAPYLSKTIYFKPDCTDHPPTGGTGGENYGVLAEFPALVK